MRRFSFNGWGRPGKGLTMGIDESPKRKQRKADARKREEKKWANKSGPVTHTWVDPRELLMRRVNEETMRERLEMLKRPN
jgi:hypothetical protein